MPDFRSNVKGNGVQLINIKLEQRTSDPSLAGSDDARIWQRTDLDQIRYYDGAAVRIIRDASTLIVSADIADGTIVSADLDPVYVGGAQAVPGLRALAIGSGATLKGMPGNIRLNDIASNNLTGADVDLNNFKLINVTNPSNAQDAATKAYVDAAFQGLQNKTSVRVATTAAGTLASAFENGDTVDGVVLATGNRILIKDQAAGAENGIYTVNASGAPTRATDADISAEVKSGLFVFVQEGTVNADTGWQLTTNDPITLGTTALTFVQFTGAGQITAGAGMTKTGNTLDVVAADGSITVNADSVTVGNVPVAKGGTGGTTAATARQNLQAAKRFFTNLGDGSATSFTIAIGTHGMNADDAMVIQVWSTVAGVATLIEADVSFNTSTGLVTIGGFLTAPAVNELTVVMIGLD